MLENEIMENLHVFIRIKCRFKCDCYMNYLCQYLNDQELQKEQCGTVITQEHNILRV